MVDLGLTLMDAPKKVHPQISNAAKALCGIAAVAVLWEGSRAIGLMDARDLPSVFAILQAAARTIVDGNFLAAFLATLRASLLGLLIATILGCVAGVAIALMPRLEMTVRPLIEFIRPIPSVALIPIALMTLGAGHRMQLLLIVFASIWPVLFNAKAGAESVDPRFLETGRIFGLSRREQIWRILLPSMLPMTLTGVRTAAAVALMLAITVEMLTGQPGIGFFIQNARLNGQATEMWAVIFITGWLGYATNYAFLALQRFALPWSQENRDD